MKKIIFFMVVLSLFAFNTHGAELKIGYVDLNRALNESDQGKEAINALEKMVKARQVIIDEKGREIEKVNEEILKLSSVLTPEGKREKEEQRKKLLRNYKRMVKDSQEEVQKKQVELMQKILTDLRKIVTRIGEKEGYIAVFEVADSGILYMPSKLDLTEEVIKRFNKSTKTTENEEQKTKN